MAKFSQDKLQLLFHKCTLINHNKLLILFFLIDTEGITVGKFYATFLIQEYFRKFKKKRQDERRKKNADNTVAFKVRFFKFPTLKAGVKKHLNFYELHNICFVYQIINPILPSFLCCISFANSVF